MLSFWLFIYSTNIYWAIVCSGSVLGASGRVSTGQTILLSQSLVSTRIRKKRACALHTSSSLWLHLSLKLHTSLLLWDITQKTNIGTWLNDPNPCGISWVVMCQGRCHLLGTGLLSGSSLPRDSKMTSGPLCPCSWAFLPGFVESWVSTEGS